MVIALCALSWMAVELVSGHRYSNLSILFWNTMVRMGIFTSVGYALMRIRELQILRQDMVNYVVHDLRNPLFVIMAHMEIQKNSRAAFDNITDSNCIDECLIAGTRMMTLINSILDLSRLESGKMPVQKKNVPVAEIVNTALREVSVYARHRGVTLRSDIAENLGNIYADNTLTVRILVNLLSNAIKVAPERSFVDIRVRLKDNQHAVFSVIDQGSGIPRKYLGSVFNKFVQVELQRAGVSIGSGLGLSFCRLATEAQEGRIWLRSDVDQGTSVHFTLPISE